MTTSVTLPESKDIRAFFTAKRDKMSTRLKWGLGFLSVLVLAPVSYFVAYALFGAAMAGLAGIMLAAVWLVGVNLLPQASMRLANWRLKELKAEAERNPVETLQLQQVEIEAGLEREKDEITKFDSAVETYRGTLLAEAHEFPEAAAAGLPVLRGMEHKLLYRRSKFKVAQKNVSERRRRVKSAAAMFRVALQAQEVTKVSGDNERSVLDKILEDVAFSSIDSTVNTSMAELRTSIMAEEVPPEELQALSLPAPAQLAPGLDINALLSALQPVANNRFDPPFNPSTADVIDLPLRAVKG